MTIADLAFVKLDPIAIALRPDTFVAQILVRRSIGYKRWLTTAREQHPPLPRTGFEPCARLDLGHAPWSVGIRKRRQPRMEPDGKPVTEEPESSCVRAEWLSICSAAEFGGMLLTAPEDIPCGRLAAVAEPDGVVFKLVAGCGLMPGAES